MKGSAFGWLAVLLLFPTVGFGEQDEVATRAARDFGNEGIDRFEKGDYAGALDRLERAYRVIHVPTLGLWYARALAKNGKLVEASERYLEASRIPSKPDDPPVFAESRQQAVQENDALQARIPKLEIVIDGAAASEVAVTVDGKPVDSALVGAPFAANPGTHQISAKRGAQVATQSVSLFEGGVGRAVLAFGGATGPAPVVATGGPPVRDAGTTTAGHSQRTWAYVAFGVGGAALVAGGVMHLLAKGKESDLEGVCRGDACPRSAQGDIDTYRTYGTLAQVGAIAGGVGIAAGAVLLLTAPSGPAKSTHLSPWVGLGSAGVKGAF